MVPDDDRPSRVVAHHDAVWTARHPTQQLLDRSCIVRASIVRASIILDSIVLAGIIPDSIVGDSVGTFGVVAHWPPVAACSTGPLSTSKGQARGSTRPAVAGGSTV